MISQGFLSPLEFRFSIKRLPNVTFAVQSVNLPDISVGVFEYPTPLRPYFQGGDKIQYGDLNLNIRVDEDMKSYVEIYNWITGLAKPDSTDQFRALENSDFGLYSDATLTIFNSYKNPKIEVTFRDIFPTSITAIEFDTTLTDVENVSCSITFKHNGFSIKTI